MSKQEEKTTDSAEVVQQRYLLDLVGVDLQFNTIKCGTCKAVTPHQWMMIPVLDTLGILSVLETNQMARRLLLCQNCGTMRLIK